MSAEQAGRTDATSSASSPPEPLTYRSGHKPTWCAGCGDFGVLNALYKAMADLRAKPEDFVIVSGIGCSSRLPEFVNAYGFHSIHGRLLTIATGVKLARPELEVLAVGGDGDGLAIGGNHFMHAARRNVDIAYVMMDNSVYGMTKGQPSPTAEMGTVSKAAPFGVLEQPVNPAALAIAFGATFVARGFGGRPKELESLIVEAISHRGFAFLHVLSPCVTFLDSYDYWRSRLMDVEQHDVKDRFEAFRLASLTDNIRTGILYMRQEETLDDKYASLGLKARKDSKFRIEDLLAEYR